MLKWICDYPSGKQDQCIAAFGGLQFIRFNPDGTIFVDPIVCNPDTKKRLQDGLLLLYTGMTRTTRGLLGIESQVTRENPDKKAAPDGWLP